MVYGFESRTWESVNVQKLTPARFKPKILDTLGMSENRKNLLKALAKKLQVERRRGHGYWSADFVEGKGKSLELLLHGSPGKSSIA